MNKKSNLFVKTPTGLLKKLVATEAEKLKPRDRREFLKKGIQLAGAISAGSLLSHKAYAGEENLPPNVPIWSKSIGWGVSTRPYGKPSDEQAHVVRRNVPWLTADTISSISFTPIADTEGIITPNGLVFERYHAGVPTVKAQDHRLMIHGLVERPIILSMEDLQRFPSVSKIHFIECPANGGMEWKGAQMELAQFTHGMTSCCEWTGVPLKVLLDEVGVKPEGKWILAEGADGAMMTRSIPMEKALDDVLVVYAQNGEMLRPENGYPLRLICPGWEANISIKWLRRLKIGDKPWHHREETSKYTDLMPDGRSKRFTYVMEANSVVLSPCPEKPWKHGAGWYELEGLAWSGYGRISGVDVSIDGGRNWMNAPLKGLVLPKAWTRFGLPFKWDGQPLLVASRARDESGYVQPSISSMRQSRGVNNIYHKNAIKTWKLSASGIASNVEVQDTSLYGGSVHE